MHHLDSGQSTLDSAVLGVCRIARDRAKVVDLVRFKARTLRYVSHSVKHDFSRSKNPDFRRVLDGKRLSAFSFQAAKLSPNEADSAGGRNEDSRCEGDFIFITLPTIRNLNRSSQTDFCDEAVS